MFKTINNGILLGIGFCLTIFFCFGLAYGWSGLTASDGDTLDYTKWNDLVDQAQLVNSIKNMHIAISGAAGSSSATASRPSVTCSEDLTWNTIDCILGQDTEGNDYRIISGGGYCDNGYYLRQSSIWSATKYTIACVLGSTTYANKVAGVELVVIKTN